jgi:hypothetical protein
MAYSFNNHSITASGLSLPRPFTIACWFYTTLAGRGLFRIRETTDRCGELLVNNSGNVIFQQIGSSSTTATSSNTFSANTWSHACGVSAAANSRTVYLDGTGTSNTANVATLNNATNIEIGWSFFAGRLAECGIWDIALTADDVASLAKGYTCDRVRPESLIFYAPLVRNIQDIIEAKSLSNSGATVIAHPRVY